MEGSLRLRALIIVVVVAAAAFSAAPPSEKIKLGLDLRGGMHMVMKVETDDAIKVETDNAIDTILRELEENAGVTGVEVDRAGLSTFRLGGVPDDKYDFVEDDIIDDYLPGWGLRRTGGQLEFDLDNAEERRLRQLAVNQAQETIRNRVDAFGVAEPVVHGEGLGSERIVVQLPGVDDPERVKEVMKNTAFLEFRLVKAGTGPFGTRQQAAAALSSLEAGTHEVMVEFQRDENKNVVGESFWILERNRVITGRNLKDASVTADDFNQPAVAFNVDKEGASRLEEATGANIGRGLAIVLDGKVISAPTIQGRISNRGSIHGQFSLQEVQDMVTVLRSGALPASLTYLEERTVGPTLGLDSILKSRKAGLIGGILVVFTMLFVYRLSGINAVLALGLNIVLVFGTLAAFEATLTLPGIAGIVLTIGMAVDANVLIFERIKEELRAGRTVRSSIAAGFEKALSSILDANITTMIAAIFLFTFGTGPIRGFAVTLSVGILASLFTAVFVSRWLFDLQHSRRQRVEKLSI